MSKLLFILLFTLSGCGKSVIDPTFSPYIESFTKEGELQGKKIEISNLSVYFVDILDDNNPNNAGECSKTLFFPGSIHVKTSAWINIDAALKEELIYHELGHCVLGRGHKEDKFPNGNPMSIMYPSLIPSDIYLGDKSYYMVELFNE